MPGPAHKGHLPQPLDLALLGVICVTFSGSFTVPLICKVIPMVPFRSVAPRPPVTSSTTLEKSLSDLGPQFLLL